MEIHKVKPWHGWRELLKEVGTIVIGVLIAIGAEQTVEALHHRAQAREMAEKLRAESEENRPVIAYDVESLQAGLASTDAILVAFAKGESAAPRLQKPDLYRPADAAWIAIRDSALLPIMPKRLIDNAWKVEATNDHLGVKIREIGQDADRAEAALAVHQSTPGDADLGRTARLRLAELRVEEAGLIGTMGEFQQINEQMLRGQRIDTAADLLKARARK
ncbi:MAG: hypothetical protein JWM33_1442 [Caulobacteraceae bacterium]|nr:hypothetical protein [Caulobacteraceae bacterium]